MPISKGSSSALRASVSALVTGFVLGLSMPAPVEAETTVRVASFQSVGLRDGGRVILRHGPRQRVTLLSGSTDYTAATIEAGGRLVIDRCQGRCPRGYELVVEVVTPEVVDVMVEDGGTIQSSGNFPRQAELAVHVNDGGTIDLRSMTADIVSARVHSGGRILTKPKSSLVAKVAQGGIITYWGSPRVSSSVEHGGVVSRGAAADADKSLEDLGMGPHTSPPLPVVPPAPPAPTSRRRGTL